jgi:hypothetical protein
MSNAKELAICFVAALVFVYIQSFERLLMVAGLTALIYASYQIVKRIR